MPKSDRVIKAAEAASPPWECDLEPGGEEGWSLLNLVRGDELISITWDDKDSLVHPLVYSLSGVREVKLRNVAEAMKTIAGQPVYTQKRAAPAARKEPAEPREVKEIPLPFSIIEATDAEIIKAVRGKRLVWRNKMTGEFESGVVPDRKLIEIKDPDNPGKTKSVWRTSPNIKMAVTSAGRRVLTFPAVGEQFRSLGLDTLVQVK